MPKKMLAPTSRKQDLEDVCDLTVLIGGFQLLINLSATSRAVQRGNAKVI